MSGVAAPQARLAGFYPPPFAGEPIHVKQLAEFLRRRGFTVDVLNLNRHAQPSPEYWSTPNRWSLVARLMRLPHPSSILHLHTNGHGWKSWMMIVAAAVAVRIRRAPAILTIHSGLFRGYVSTFGPARALLAGWTLRAFARIIAVNAEIARAMQMLGVDASRVRVIPAFMGVTPPPPLQASDRAVVGKFRRLLVTVAGGENDPEFRLGLLVVLRAVKELVPEVPGLGAVFVGWNVGPRVAPLIRELELEEHALCLGEVPHDRSLALLAAADVVVRSTFADGDSITVREALALGVPVVASDTDFRPPGVTLFKKGDAADLATKLREVLSRGPAARAVSSQAECENARELWQVYDELANRPEGHPTVAPLLSSGDTR